MLLTSVLFGTQLFQYGLGRGHDGEDAVLWNWLSRIKRKKPCCLCQFLWFKYSYYGWFPSAALTTRTQRWEVTGTLKSHAPEERVLGVNSLSCGWRFLVELPEQTFCLKCISDVKSRCSALSSAPAIICRTWISGPTCSWVNFAGLKEIQTFVRRPARALWIPDGILASSSSSSALNSCSLRKWSLPRERLELREKHRNLRNRATFYQRPFKI